MRLVGERLALSQLENSPFHRNDEHEGTWAKTCCGGSSCGTVHLPGSRGRAMPRCSPSSQQVPKPLEGGWVPLMFRGDAGGCNGCRRSSGCQHSSECPLGCAVAGGGLLTAMPPAPQQCLRPKWCTSSSAREHADAAARAAWLRRVQRGFC